ncbi:MAG: hypothetical protein R3E97_12095 [Candidatus Eisenbacteria bacterium]
MRMSLHSATVARSVASKLVASLGSVVASNLVASLRPTGASTSGASLRLAVASTSGVSFRLVVASIVLLVAIGCGTDSTKPSVEAPSLRLSLTSTEREDPRTYSVGRVQLRVFDEEDVLLNSDIFEVSRETGLFAIDFTVPAGPNRTLLVEPLGSAVLPDGGKTNSGVALQAIVPGLDVLPDELVEVDAVLEPFIPDSVFVGSRGEELELFWTPMEIAESHRVRVIEEDLAGDSLIARLVDVPRDDHWGSVLIDRLRSSDAPGPFVGFQVQSINEFAESAFSDTAMFSR